MLNKQGTVEYKGHQTWEKNVRTSLVVLKLRMFYQKPVHAKQVYYVSW